MRGQPNPAKRVAMRSGVSNLVMIMLLASGCSTSGDPADSSKNCELSLPDWHDRDVEPPNLVKIWDVRVQPDDVVLDGRPTSDDAALGAIEATKEYDPGAYVLLHGGAAKCSRVRKFARQVSERFNCARSYCFLVRNAN